MDPNGDITHKQVTFLVYTVSVQSGSDWVWYLVMADSQRMFGVEFCEFP